MQKTKETQVQSLSQEDPLEEGMATHSSIFAWRIPWTEESGGLQSMGSQRVRHDWSDWARAHTNMMWTHCTYFTFEETGTAPCLIQLVRGGTSPSSEDARLLPGAFSKMPHPRDTQSPWKATTWSNLLPCTNDCDELISENLKQFLKMRWNWSDKLIQLRLMPAHSLADAASPSDLAHVSETEGKR